MGILTAIRQRIDSVGAHPGMDVELSSLLESLRQLDDDAVIDVVSKASEIKHDVDRVVAIGAGVLAERSTRDRGQSGAAAVRGHSSPVSLLQSISGSTRADAARAVRVGEALLAATDPAAAAPAAGADTAPDAPVPPVLLWHEPLRRAMLAGALTPAQHDAILRRLGEPPVREGAIDEPASADAVREVWSLAASQLIIEAEGIGVEELVRRSRQVRDALDAVGVEERQARRFEERSFRMWTDADGAQHGHIRFDDETAPWWSSVIGAALRPRRGGPRFMTDEERLAADDLVADPRTNEQLTYDLITDVFRAGALATASDVFGARRPGVRMVVVKDTDGPRDAFGRMLATGHLEDGGDAIAGSVIDRALCEVGSIEITTDSCGNPLDVGREQRLFTAKQRLALSVRDGGCLWPGCRVPASYCEAHHGDHWSLGGRTDVDAGILLCRFHHMLLQRRVGDSARRERSLRTPSARRNDRRPDHPAVQIGGAVGVGSSLARGPQRMARRVSTTARRRRRGWPPSGCAHRLRA